MARASVPNTYEPRGDLARIYHKLIRLGHEPLIVIGGWQGIESWCSHLMETSTTESHKKQEETPWYPSLIIPGLLYLGHSEMASDRKVLSSLGITHIVTISERVPPDILPALNYLVIPIPENDPVNPSQPSVCGNLVASLPTMKAFVDEARQVSYY